MPQLENISERMAADPMFASKHGETITRERACECGRRFTQRLLSERFLAMVEKHSRNAIAILTKQIPGFYVPVHCPSCERRDLGRQARMDDMRHEPAPPYGEAAD